MIAVIQRARQAGVGVQLLPAIDIPSIHAALDLARRHEGMYVMAALHPSDTRDATDEDFARIESLSEEPEVVAIGETGLDYYWVTSFNEKQKDFLRRHIRLAYARDLPLVFHNRQASADLGAMVRDEQARVSDPGRIRGVFHCFGGSPEFADAVIGLGFHVGIGGTLTFKNAGVPAAIESIPLERIVLENRLSFSCACTLPRQTQRTRPRAVGRRATGGTPQHECGPDRPGHPPQMHGPSSESREGGLTGRTAQNTRVCSHYTRAF